MSESEPPDRLARLGRRLDAARARRDGPSAAGRGDPALQQGMAAGLRIGVELVVAIVVATALGWGIDRWLGTSPWLTIALFFLGVAAGMVNVYRAVTGVRMAVGYRRPDASDGARRPAKGKRDGED